MPTIQYPNHPNTDTAFVVQDDGTKNRALMTAPQDTSTLELPKNANSCKGYVTINGKKQRVVMTADITGGGSGSDVDRNTVVNKIAVLPTADASTAGQVYMYDGVTDATYTNGYIYKNVKTATYTGTVSFEAATISGTTVACSGDNFANFLTESGVEPLSVVSGTMTYDTASSLWVLVGKNANNETVLTFQEYQQDFVDAGFTFTGTPEDGDVIAFTCTVAEASATYAWTRIDVQPTPEGLPDQTGQSGKFLTTDGTDASWGDALQNDVTNTDPQQLKKLAIGTGRTSFPSAAAHFVAIGYKANVQGDYTVSIGASHDLGGAPIASGTGAVAIGYTARCGYGSVSIGSNTNTYSSIGYASYTISIGDNAKAYANHSIAIGCYTGGLGAPEATAECAIQLGCGKEHSGISTNIWQNNDANTFKVGNNNGNFEMMSADGTIPAARHAALPSADGTYVLKLVIANGVPTLSWVAE